MATIQGADFALRLIAWQRDHGRHDLPWQGADAYRVWLSEIMLQQTQVATVIPYYERFIAAFPSIVALAAAAEEQVLAHWSGLGYYARGRNLHRAARLIVEHHQGEFPQAFDAMLALPGVGRSTAAAIGALAFNQRHAILDGNVKRLLARYCGLAGWTGDKKIQEQLWQQAEALLPLRDVAIYIQAQMDMGATLCTRTRPRCAECPVHDDCIAYQTDRVHELPTPRPHKTVPEKRATLLLLMHGNDVFLEKRPPQGIWGGLWCLPQLDDGAGVTSADYARRNGLQIYESIDLESLTHTFTHFKLHINPVLLRLEQRPLPIRQPGCIWLGAQDALNAAIPAPVRTLLVKYAGKAI